VFPEFAPPEVEVRTETPGLTPEQVEVLITTPIENAITGTAGVAAVRSQSIQGLSDITVVFTTQTDVVRARQAVAERLTEVVRQLPVTARPPVITPLISSTGTVLVVGITSATRSLREQRTFVDWTLTPRLLAVPGVGRVSVQGGEVRQLQIRLEPDRMRADGVGIADVVAAAERATGVRGAGAIETRNQLIRVRTEGQLLTPALLAGSVIRASGGSVLHLGDVARVVEGSEPRVGAGAIEGTEGIVINVEAQLGANVRTVAAAVEDALDGIAPTIAGEGLTLHRALFRPSTFIDLALHNVLSSLFVGGVLVAIVLLLFLADLGAAAVSLTAIPLSLVTALVVLDRFGLTLNTLTLGGLAIAIGEVVDDAIIDVENIARRLRENRASPHPRSATDVVIDASLEVRSSVVYATFVVALVFLPVIGLTGVQGAFFRPLGLAYLVATFASLVVALTVTPALTLLVLSRRNARVGEPRLLTVLKRGYVTLLEGISRWPLPVIGVTLLIIIAACALVPGFGGTFLPEFNEGHLRVHASAVPGTSLEETLAIGRIVTATLHRDPRVRLVAQRAGRAELAEDTYGTHYSEFEVDLVPETGERARSVEGDLRTDLAAIPGVSFAVIPYLTERIEETLSGETAPLVIKIFGADLDSLDAAAARVAAAIRVVRGVTDVAAGSPAVTPEVTVRLDPTALAMRGISGVDALDAVETATLGTTVGQVFEGSRSTDVVVRLDPARLGAPEDLATLPLTGTAGRVVPLGQVANIARTTGRYAVAHDGARRVQTVTADVVGRDISSVSSDVEDRIHSEVTLPRGVYVDVGGAASAEHEAQQELLARSALAGAGIVVLLWMAFGDARRLGLILANVPFALVGGIAAVALTGGVISLGSLVGFVTLFGIATRNAIMLVSHYDHLVRVEGVPWGPAAALRGASERLGPILMTALVAGLGLLPLAIGSGDPGREIEGPMAVVIVGGLVTSTILSLVVLPTLALRYGRFGDLGGVESRDEPQEAR
jgi:CzcA family heavy metal efflux pump